MKTHTGFTLIEVLIAMLILAGGLLGLAALQTTSIRSNLAAYNYGQATQLLYDMADRMRANVCTPNPSSEPPVTCPSATPPDYITTGTNGDVRTKNVTVSNPACTKTDPCNAAQLSTYDLVTWNNAMLATLPMGRGCITQTVVGAVTTYNLYITWDDNRSGTVTTDATLPTGCTFSTYVAPSAGISHDPIFSISLQL